MTDPEAPTVDGIPLGTGYGIEIAPGEPLFEIGEDWASWQQPFRAWITHWEGTRYERVREIEPYWHVSTRLSDGCTVVDWHDGVVTIRKIE